MLNYIKNLSIESLTKLLISSKLKELRVLEIVLRGPTLFEDMIFYLWTDSNEICTAYVKLKKKSYFILEKIFDFQFSF